MKYKIIFISFISFLSIKSIEAQDIKDLTLKQAVQLALTNNDEIKLAETKIKTAKEELSSIKNSQYPDFKISGQYNYLSSADVNLKLNLGTTNTNNNSGQSSPVINQLLLGQASLSMPLFSGFKLKNTIEANENNFQATKLMAKNSNEQISIQTIENYINLYKTLRIIELIEENLKSAHQRVTDFIAMESNGLLAKNDLLKSEIQESTIELSLEEAKNNAKILNYELAVSLKLPENTTIKIEEPSIEIDQDSLLKMETSSRADLEALLIQEKIASNNLNIKRGNYYPSVALIGGYTALNIANALSVYNAMNIGIGVSYNISDIFKNNNQVEVAKSQLEETNYQLKIATDKVKVQIENARQNYLLSISKLKVFEKSKVQAIENYEIVKDKFNNGLAATNDLLEADVQQLQSKINLSNANATIALKYYELLFAEGNLTNKINN